MSEDERKNSLKDQVFRGVSGSRHVEIPKPSIKPGGDKVNEGIAIETTNEEVWDACSELNLRLASDDRSNEGPDLELDLDLEGMQFEKI